MASAKCEGYSLAALSAPACPAGARLDERLMAWHADSYVRAGVAKIDWHPCAGVGLDRHRAQFSRVLRVADIDRPAHRGRALSLFHPPRPRASANVAWPLVISTACSSPFASSHPRCGQARVLRAPRFCVLLPDPCK